MTLFLSRSYKATFRLPAFSDRKVQICARILHWTFEYFNRYWYPSSPTLAFYLSIKEGNISVCGLLVAEIHVSWQMRLLGKWSAGVDMSDAHCLRRCTDLSYRYVLARSRILSPRSAVCPHSSGTHIFKCIASFLNTCPTSFQALFRMKFTQI